MAVRADRAEVLYWVYLILFAKLRKLTDMVNVDHAFSVTSV